MNGVNVWRGQKRPKGKVCVWGWNYFCQLGLEHHDDQYQPTEITKLAKAKCVFICLGDNFCTTVTEKGYLLTYPFAIPILPFSVLIWFSIFRKVYSWGLGNDGQLGHGDKETGSFPREIVSLRKNNIVLVACGENHSLFLKKSGGVYSGKLQYPPLQQNLLLYNNTTPHQFSLNSWGWRLW